jgi:hypothetical protein
MQWQEKWVSLGPNIDMWQREEMFDHTGIALWGSPATKLVITLSYRDHQFTYIVHFIKMKNL